MNLINFFASSKIDVNGIKIEVEFDRGFINPTAINDKPHNHASFELTAVISGKLALNVDDKVLNIEAGEFIILPPRIYHHNILDGSAFERLGFRFSIAKSDYSSESSRIIEQLKNPVIYKSEEVISYTQAIQHELKNKLRYSDEMIEAMLKCLFISLFRMTAVGSDNKSSAPNSLPSRTKIIDAFFSFRYAEQVTVGDLAKELGLSAPQTNRMLQRYYGQGFREKLRKTRISEACKLILSSGYKFSVIAYKVGYLSESGFFVAFRKETGMTPEEYKERHKVV